MLISKEVEVTLSRKMKSYYEKLGYKIPKHQRGKIWYHDDNCKIIVKIEDLSPMSTVPVKVICDYCGKEIEKKYCNYNIARKNLKKDSCDECKHIKGSETNKLKFTKIQRIIANGDNQYQQLRLIDINDTGKHGIYRIVNNINKKYYIGSTNDLNKRMNAHTCELSINKHHSIHLQRSYNKYGKENFIFEILEYVEEMENKIELKKILIEKEQYWIDFYNSSNDKYGYNICKNAYSPLGHTKGSVSEETKRKISIANKGRKRPDMWGTNSHLAKLSEEDVINIKVRMLNGDKINDIAIDYKADLSSIYDIKNGITWKHIMPNVDLLSHYRKNNIVEDKIAIEIKERLNKGEKGRDLAKEYNISESTISGIKNNKHKLAEVV
jgi:group I intron endonuclease